MITFDDTFEDGIVVHISTFCLADLSENVLASMVQRLLFHFSLVIQDLIRVVVPLLLV